MRIIKNCLITKSEFIKDIIKLKKLTITKTNCRNDRDNIVWLICLLVLLKSLIELDKKRIRVGGMVKEKSVIINSNQIEFIITDFKNEINVVYSGAVPNLFAEGKGVVAEGFLKDKNYFTATKILAKHDENYMPPEVKKAIGDK